MILREYLHHTCQKRQANIDFLEALVKRGVEVNGSGTMKLDGAEKEYLLLTYVYIRGVTNQKAEEYLNLLLGLRKLVSMETFENKVRIFDPDSPKICNFKVSEK